MAGTYTHINFIQFRNYIADLLDDPGKVFWTDDELKSLTNEALRTWGLASAYWRERNSLSTIVSTPWYDIRTALGGNLLTSTVTDQEVLKSVQLALLEDASSQSVWNGTDMWSLAEMAQMISASRNRFMVETGQILNVSTINMPAPPIYRVSLDDTIVDVRRAVWFDTGTSFVNQVVSTLYRVDEWSLVSLDPNWPNTPGIPFAHSILTTKPLTLLVAPPPITQGTLELITTNALPLTDPSARSTVLQILDNSFGVVKWGTILAALSGDGQASDTTRYGIAQQRWKEGIELTKISPTIFYAEINGVPVRPVNIFSLDTLQANWESAKGAPTILGVMGQNLVGMATVPDGIYSVTLDVARNAPLPTLDTDFVQLGREEIAPVAGYAAWLGLFKIGGNELVDGEKYVKAFYDAASIYNARLKASALFTDSVFRIALSEGSSRPRSLAIPQPPQGQGGQQ